MFVDIDECSENAKCSEDRQAVALPCQDTFNEY